MAISHILFTRTFNRWRALRLALILLVLSAAGAAYVYIWARPAYSIYAVTNESERARSIRLLEHNKGRRYVLFKQLRGAGFNNQVQELLLYHHLTQLTSRTYVYQPLIMRARGERAEAPLTAFLPALTQDGISVEFFEFMCPPERVRHVTLGNMATRNDIWGKAIEVLSGEDQCVSIDDHFLNWDYLASPAIHSIWPGFQEYLANHFSWSHHILEIVGRTYTKLGLRSARSVGDSYLAIHFRRGDFENHCYHLAATHTGFTTWATLPILRDSIKPPMLDISDPRSVVEHCYPSIPRIVSAVALQMKRKPGVQTAYILNDAAWDHPLVYLQRWKLAAALKDIGIRRIVHSGMIARKLGEKDWIVAADVELARNAEVFIGIGYSSLSTHVIALRLGADHGKTEDITLL